MVAMRHRMSIGTIVSERAMKVQYLRGRTLGSVEETFIARLRPGDHFIFAGTPLEFVRVRDMVAVRAEVRAGSHVGRAALVGRPAADLARARRAASAGKLDEARQGIYRGPEMEAVRPILELQAAWSRLPAADELLIERVKTREGHHLFFYPFEGRLVHEGLAALFAYRIAQLGPIPSPSPPTTTGFELLSRRPAPDSTRRSRPACFSPEHLLHDIPASLNATEMARRQFREIARVAGLVFQGYPGVNKIGEAGAGVERAVLRRLRPLRPGQPAAVPGPPRGAGAPARAQPAGPRRWSGSPGRVSSSRSERPTPLAFPLLVDRAREQVSSEKLADRIRRMVAPLEKAADAPRVARGGAGASGAAR